MRRGYLFTVFQVNAKPFLWSFSYNSQKNTTIIIIPSYLTRKFRFEWIKETVTTFAGFLFFFLIFWLPVSFLLTTLLNLIPRVWKQSRIGLLSIADQGMFSAHLGKLASISPWTTIFFLMLIPWFREAAWSLTALLSRSPARATLPTSVFFQLWTGAGPLYGSPGNLHLFIREELSLGDILFTRIICSQTSLEGTQSPIPSSFISRTRKAKHINSLPESRGKKSFHRHFLGY